MNTQVRVNGTKLYTLERWNWADFASSMSLVIQSMDLVDVRDTFENITKIEIIKNEEIVAVYTSFDTFSNISYMGKVFFEESQSFADAMRVELSKANIVDQVQRLDDQINGVVDPETLSLEELRQYKLGEIGKACEQDIFDGKVIRLTDGTEAKFSFNMQDQANWFELFCIAFMIPEMEQFPQHFNNGSCQLFSRNDIIIIETSLLLNKMEKTTYCNQLNLYVRSLQTREELLNIQYGMELPQEYMDKINELVGTTIAQMQEFMERMHILPTEDDSEDPTLEEN